MEIPNNIRVLLFLSQETYARLLSVSLSLIALVESNRRILRGSPLARETKLIQEWMTIPAPENIAYPAPVQEAAEARSQLTNRKAKLERKKIKLERKSSETGSRKHDAYTALHFYEKRNAVNDTETEALVFGIGKRTAMAETTRQTLWARLEAEKRQFLITQEIGWIDSQIKKL